ncbi:MAG: hypothetical protein M0021_12245 [Clostridia bacterium]|nr:hypothetical protein [Clostridia bacterium]
MVTRPFQVWVIICVGFICLSGLSSGSLAWAAAVSPQQGVNQPITSYPPDQVKFHSAGHIQRWQRSPLGQQEPHLWTLLALLLVGGTMTGVGYRLHRKQRDSGLPEIEQGVLSGLEERKKRLQGKLANLEAKLHRGEVSQAEYAQKSLTYRGQIDLVEERLIELKDWKEGGQ